MRVEWNANRDGDAEAPGDASSGDGGSSGASGDGATPMDSAGDCQREAVNVRAMIPRSWSARLSTLRRQMHPLMHPSNRPPTLQVRAQTSPEPGAGVKHKMSVARKPPSGSSRAK